MLFRTMLLTMTPLAFIGCSTTREIVDAREGPSSAQALEMIQEKSITVVLRDSSMFDGDVVPCGQDSIAVMMGPHGERRSVPLRDLRIIRFATSDLAYVAGGAVLGGAIGAGIALAVNESVSSGGLDMSGVAAMLGGGVGLLRGGG